MSPHKFAWWLVILGGLNWGLVGLFGFNAIAYLGAPLTKVGYVLVGLSAAYLAFNQK